VSIVLPIMTGFAPSRPCNRRHLAKSSWKDSPCQQDNATPHILPTEPQWVEVTGFYALPENGGWDIQLAFQPPNSPDLNILDLAMFRSLQAIQQRHQTRNIDQLIEIVKQCWRDFPLATSIKVWSSLQLVMNEVIKAGGSNNYKLPHFAKDRFVRTNGRPVPMRLECTALHPQAAAPAQAQAAAASPQAAAQAEDSSPTSVSADLGEDETGIITSTLADLSLEASVEMDVDWEDITAELEWGDDAGHTADGDGVIAGAGEAMI
jgi:hypothetical protein